MKNAARPHKLTPIPCLLVCSGCSSPSTVLLKGSGLAPFLRRNEGRCPVDLDDSLRSRPGRCRKVGRMESRTRASNFQCITGRARAGLGSRKGSWCNCQFCTFAIAQQKNEENGVGDDSTR